MAMEKTFDAGTAEPRIYAKWEADGAFKAGANARPGADPFTIMIPPPNVTGSLHMGHAFNNTLQDILIRWHRMRGFDTLWQPGTDHAGIATQMVTERSMAANGEPSRRDMGRERFVERVWQQKAESRSTIIGQLKRLGASADWSREAFTMGGAAGDPDAGSSAPNFHDAVIKVFVEMHNKGLIYKGKRLVNWDPHFETAISDLEVENIDVAGHMWHFKYPLANGATYEYLEKDEDGNVTFSETRDYIAIATTRPETMLGDGAVAVHPDDGRYATIVGKLCEIPVGPKEHRRLIPIITDEYPDMTFGSGAVKITGAHDFNDYQVAKRGGIPMYSLMDTKGAMRADGLPYDEEAAMALRIANGEERFDEAKIAAMNLVPDEYRGMDRFEARKAVVADINAEGLAVMHDITRSDKESGKDITETVPFVEAKSIMQPFGDRSKVVIEPMLTDQWFVDTAKIVQPAIDAVRSGEVTILPESDRKVYFHWLENIEPWCISRQLWWGHQVPVWYAPTLLDGPDGPHAEWKAFCATSQHDAFDQMEDYYGHRDFKIVIDRSEAAELLAIAVGNTRTEGKIRTPQAPSAIPVYRDPDVLDTWFSSGLWPLGTLGWPENTDELKKYFPTSTLITGSDILFFWVARMMMMQLESVGQVPFKTVYLHGLVRDDKGKKMSKSTGNVIDPLDIIDEFGADALRFTNAAMASLGGALKLDKTRIQGYRNFGTKLWNATRFAEMNGVFDMEKLCITSASDVQATQTANKWIIGEVARTRQEVDAALQGFRFNDAANALYTFTWGKVCDWYVEFAKPLLDGAHADETRATMAWVLDQCYIMLHPIMPFITEELWGLTGKRDKPLIHADWPEYGLDLIDAEADREMNWVIALIDGIRSARSQMRVPAGLKIPVILHELDARGRAALEGNKALIMKLARIDTITEMAELPKGASPVPVEGGAFALPLADIIDVAAEISRLEKSIGKLGKELGGLRGRLNNPKFADSAPAAVVAETRANLALREEEEATLQAALTRLREIG